jgi:hypothetical protein
MFQISNVIVYSSICEIESNATNFINILTNSETENGGVYLHYAFIIHNHFLTNFICGLSIYFS